MGGRDVTGRKKSFFLREYDWSRSYKEVNQHPSLPWNFITHGFLDPSAFPEKKTTPDQNNPVSALRETVLLRRSSPCPSKSQRVSNAALANAALVF